MSARRSAIDRDARSSRVGRPVVVAAVVAVASITGATALRRALRANRAIVAVIVHRRPVRRAAGYRPDLASGDTRLVWDNIGDMVSKLRMGMRFVVAACLFVSGSPIRVTAACVPPPPLCESAARADLVFYGEALEETTYTQQTERGPLPQGIQAVRFNILRSFKGAQPGEWWGLFYFGIEATSFKTGAQYLVVAHRRATGAFVTGCTLTHEIATRAEQEEWSRTSAELSMCKATTTPQVR